MLAMCRDRCGIWHPRKPQENLPKAQSQFHRSPCRMALDQGAGEQKRLFMVLPSGSSHQIGKGAFIPAETTASQPVPHNRPPGIGQNRRHQRIKIGHHRPSGIAHHKGKVPRNHAAIRAARAPRPQVDNSPKLNRPQFLQSANRGTATRCLLRHIHTGEMRTHAHFVRISLPARVTRSRYACPESKIHA